MQALASLQAIAQRAVVVSQSDQAAPTVAPTVASATASTDG
jgi:hypothetical protein